MKNQNWKISESRPDMFQKIFEGHRGMPAEQNNYSIKSFRIKYQAAEPLPKKLLTSPERVADTTRALINEFDGGMSVEHFGAFFLNAQNELMGFKLFATGTIDQVAVYPRMVIHTALLIGASALVIPPGITTHRRTIRASLMQSGRPGPCSRLRPSTMSSFHLRDIFLLPTEV
jgi:hypothetical protein